MIRTVRFAATCFLTLTVAVGCAATRYAPEASFERWKREVSRRQVDPESFHNPLAFTEQMRAVSVEIAGRGKPQEKLERLQRYLFDRTEFAFSYESRKTLTAVETFESRSGNCVSFTNLFIAMARAAGLRAGAAMARVPVEADREGDLIVINNHVVAVFPDGTDTLVFDLDQQRERRIAGVRPIDDLVITAIYANNLGAQALLHGNAESASEFLETAVKLDPDFASAFGNLGIVRRQLGDAVGALGAYRRALELEPRSPTILSNLAALYRSQGREAEARAALQAAKLRGATPYLLISRGDLELAEGNTGKALRLYRRATRTGRELVDPWLALARAELSRERPERAMRAVRRALEVEPGNVEAERIKQRVEDLSDGS